MRRRFILWLMRTRFYKWVLKSIIPYVRFTTYYTSLRGEKYHEGYRKLQPGHIILTVDKKKLTSILIPGSMSHAALCVFKRPAYDVLLGARAFEVAEMTHTDFTRSDFFDICKESDRVVLMQCMDWDMDYISRVIDACLSYQSAKYDAEFSLGIEALYCSELIWQADRAAYFKETEMLGSKLQVDLSDFAGIGQKYLSPDGLLFAKNVRCVWDSDNAWAGLMGPQIEELELAR